MRIGTCKLCLRKRPLCESHLIPRAVYNICRARKAMNPNPLLVTHKFAMQTSRQLKFPLLCFECEQLIRAKGEDWVIPELARLNKPFPLHEKLRNAPALYVEPDFVAYVLSAVPTIRVPDLIHFVMGIFWKASIHAWAKRNGKPWLDLGAHGELVRRFLLGEAAFPDQMALCITVLPPPVTLIAFLQPYAIESPAPTFHFYICGINCTLWVGPNIPSEIVAASIHRPPHHLLIVDDAAQIKRKFRAALESAAQSKLARRR